ncbi:hypothetical protein HYALB_00012366 [Hymenoscyphus albidus]|uniref:Uncharacterized protein n=1 Tax=Hymenoscyphus albidus TaxID=595503 RepID=A0A9N9LV76_9HELO|nr:hypothetical protein HYALB_00012366 [Hymenoscyphus albidus]
MQYQLIRLYFSSMLAALSVASPTSNLQPRDKLKVQITFDVTGYSLWSQGRNPSSNTGITITIVPGGVYPTWVHNELLDGLKAAVQKAAVCKDVTYTYPSDVDRHSNSDAIYFMEFASKTTPNADGFCSTFTTLSGAVAGN